MKIKKLFSLFLVLIMLIPVLSLTGCEDNQEKESAGNGLKIYYLSKEKNKICSVPYVKVKGTNDKTVKDQVESMLMRLLRSPSDEYEVGLPKDCEILDYTLDGNQLTIYFSDQYVEMDTTLEVLTRACIVKTLIQINQIQGISFMVNDGPLRNAKGEYVGMMTEDTFIENVGQQINTIASQDITLYVASADGHHLHGIRKSVYTSTNISSEKLIVKHLLDMHKGKDYQPSLPVNTKLISVSTLDGVCIVNFDSGFLEQNYLIDEDVVIYSIVDSLCELSTVNKVQISVNGETDMVYRENRSLDELFERNLDLVENEDF